MPKLKYLNGAVNVLKWTALYPIDKKSTKVTKFFYYVWAFFFVLSFVTTDIQCVMYLLTTDFDLLTEAMIVMNAALYITLFMNFVLFYQNSNKLVKLVTNINQYFVDETDNEIEKITMATTAKLCNFMSYFWTLSVVASGVFTGMLPLLMGDRSIMPIPGWFPYDYTKSPFYEISYSWQMFCQINLGLIYGASDMIFPNMTIIIGQQFKILASNFTNNVYKAVLKCGVPKDVVCNFIRDSQNESLPSLMEMYPDIFTLLHQKNKFNETNHRYLSKNIRHHQMLLKFCEDLNEIMSPYLLTKVLLITFNMIFIVFTLITSEDQTLIVGLTCYAFFGSTELFIYNYGGQVLIQNADILGATYDCPWYLCNLKFQKTFLFLQMKLNRTIETKAGNYFSMSAPTFISFMRCIFSYAAVLKEVTTMNS